MATANRIGARVDGANRDRPPPKIFLGIGAGCLAINHLSVVIGNGLQAEALAMGCWLVLMAGWVLVGGRSFDAVWGWANRPRTSVWRAIGVAMLTLLAALGVAEAVAWFGYGQHLFG
jgi:hypothetical protein